MLTLTLSNPPSTAVTIEIFSTDGSATGNHVPFSWLLLHSLITDVFQEEIQIMGLDYFPATYYQLVKVTAYSMSYYHIRSEL